MAENNELRAGLLSGIVAGAMVLALTAMALVSFDPTAATAHRIPGGSVQSFVTSLDVASLAR